MQLQVRFIGVKASEDVLHYVRRHVDFSLGRFYSRTGRLVVRLADLNGPRGGNDKLCRVSLHGDLGAHSIEARGPDWHATVARAFDAVERRVSRELRRRRWERSRF